MPIPSVSLVDPTTQSSAEILVGFGFNCYRFTTRFEGQTVDVLWSADGFADGTHRATGSGIPLLFPFPGRIQGTEFTWHGQDVCTPGRRWPRQRDPRFRPRSALANRQSLRDACYRSVANLGRRSPSAAVVAQRLPHHRHLSTGRPPIVVPFRGHQRGRRAAALRFGDASLFSYPADPAGSRGTMSLGLAGAPSLVATRNDRHRGSESNWPMRPPTSAGV